MKQPFKKALLATAVALTCGAATAGTVSVTKQVHSSEGLTGVTATQTSNALSYTLGATYQEGDKITFTFPADTLDKTNPESGFEGVVNIPEQNAGTANARAGLTLGLLNSTVGDSADTVTYRVTTVTEVATEVAGVTTGNTVGQVFSLTSGIPYSAAALLSRALTVTVNSETAAGDTLDNSGTRTGTLAEAKSQFGSVAVAGFDAVIDVAQMRKAFLGAASDSMEWTITNPSTTGWLNLATVNATSGTVVTLKGEAGKFTDLSASNFAAGNLHGKAGTDVVDEANATVTVTYGGLTTNDTLTFTPTTGANAVVLEAQSFVSDFAYNYTSAAAQAGMATVGSNVPSGEWDLNGATVNIPYMPYGPTASQVIYVTNAGSQAGDISVTAFDNTGKTFDLGVIGTANANTVTKVAPLVNDALRAAGFSGRQASITITVNAPEDDITVHASFNIGGNDRAFIITDQYKGKE
mmetsp:Transcript_29013/g.44586  ORF Transcript_29013/g.44586 Transcript_29013/m.44586 type:complete len:466 (+) Transcript_29013:123-1520(+)